MNLTKSLAYYYARHGVTVNALAPGFVDTDGLREEEFRRLPYDDYESLALKDIPAHRLADPDEIAAVVLFLCSPAAQVHQRRQPRRRWRPISEQLDAVDRPGGAVRTAEAPA